MCKHDWVKVVLKLNFISELIKYDWISRRLSFANPYLMWSLGGLVAAPHFGTVGYHIFIAYLPFLHFITETFDPSCQHKVPHSSLHLWLYLSPFFGGSFSLISLWHVHFFLSFSLAVLYSFLAPFFWAKFYVIAYLPGYT
jgi:hypothetical protein